MKARNAAPAFLLGRCLIRRRLRLLNLLACGETCVCELTDYAAGGAAKSVASPGSSEARGVVEARRNGKWMHYRWAKHPIRSCVMCSPVLRAKWMEKDDRHDGERQRAKGCVRN